MGIQIGRTRDPAAAEAKRVDWTDRWSVHGAVRVPEVTVVFWVVKVLTTAMGEAASDWSVHAVSPYLAVLVGGALFSLAMAWQLRAERYVPWIYWTAVSMVAVFGTMCADVLHIALGVPYNASAVLFAVALAVVFVAWRRSEGTLDVHSITTTRRELFYWATVLATFAMGTAVGDLAAYDLHLGFFSAGLLFVALMALVVTARMRRVLGGVAGFWCAYVLTRPLGASFADWMGVPRSLGGLAWGRGPVTGGLTLLIVVAVAGVTARWRAEPPEGAGAGG